MSLIRCPECDRQISDRAVSCPGCGFPLSELDNYKKDNDNVVEELKKENQQQPLIIDFLERSLVIPHGYIEYLFVEESAYDKLSDILDDAEKFFLSMNAVSIDEKVSRITKTGSKATSDMIDYFYSLLKKYGVLDIDNNTFSKKVKDSTYNEAAKLIKKAEKESYEKAALQVAVREYRKNYRGRFVGGGFGIGGAIRGAIEAGVINATTGMFHSFVNEVGNKQTKKQYRKDIDAILTNDYYYVKFFNDLSISLINIIENSLDYFSELLGDSVIGRPSEEDKDKAWTIYNNLKGQDLNEPQRLDIIFEVLQLNPFTECIYVDLLKDYPDEYLTIKTVTSILCLDFISILGNYLNEDSILNPTIDEQILDDDVERPEYYFEDLSSYIHPKQLADYIKQQLDVERKNLEIIKAAIEQYPLAKYVSYEDIDLYNKKYWASYDYEESVRVISHVGLSKDMDVITVSMEYGVSYDDVLYSLYQRNYIESYIGGYVRDVFPILKAKEVTKDDVDKLDKYIVDLREHSKLFDPEEKFAKQLLADLNTCLENSYKKCSEWKKQLEKVKTPDNKYCAYCGKQIGYTAKFCNYCGEKAEIMYFNPKISTVKDNVETKKKPECKISDDDTKIKTIRKCFPHCDEYACLYMYGVDEISKDRLKVYNEDFRAGMKEKVLLAYGKDFHGTTFLLTTQHIYVNIRYIDEEGIHTKYLYNFDDIVGAVCEWDIMFSLIFRDGSKSEVIPFYGRGREDFVTKLNCYFKLMNTTPEKPKSKTAAILNVLSDSCRKSKRYIIGNPYVDINSKQYIQARNNMRLDDRRMIFIKDSSMWGGNFKSGLAVSDDGIFFSDKMIMLGWSELCGVHVICDGANVYVDGHAVMNSYEASTDSSLVLQLSKAVFMNKELFFTRRK